MRQRLIDHLQFVIGHRAGRARIDLQGFPLQVKQFQQISIRVGLVYLGHQRGLAQAFLVLGLAVRVQRAGELAINLLQEIARVERLLFLFAHARRFAGVAFHGRTRLLCLRLGRLRARGFIRFQLPQRFPQHLLRLLLAIRRLHIHAKRGLKIFRQFALLFSGTVRE